MFTLGSYFGLTKTKISTTRLDMKHQIPCTSIKENELMNDSWFLWKIEWWMKSLVRSRLGFQGELGPYRTLLILNAKTYWPPSHLLEGYVIKVKLIVHVRCKVSASKNDTFSSASTSPWRLRLVPDAYEIQIEVIASFIIIFSSWMSLLSKWNFSFLKEHIGAPNYVDFCA